MPRGVASEGEEIEMFLGNLDGTLESTFGVANGVMIVKITPEELVALAVVSFINRRAGSWSERAKERGDKRAADKMAT